jgi:hypothetical protein
MVKLLVVTEMSIVEDRKIIVLTPIKNEEWILETFLTAANRFADVIILLDQNSIDSSKEIAKKYKKVEIYENYNNGFNEKERQDILLEKARNHGSNNVIISLDADEVFSPNFNSPDNLAWLKSLEIGTSICYDWANIHWDRDKYWLSKMQPIIFIDNGQKNLDNQDFHRTRVPIVSNKKIIYNKQINVLHFQYIDKERIRSKHRWYQIYEFKNNNNISFVYLYRKYHHMFGIRKNMYKKLPKEWENYIVEIDYKLKYGVKEKQVFWWDKEIIELLNTIPQEVIAKIDLDFNLDQTKNYAKTKQLKITDRMIFRYLSITQKMYSKKFRSNFAIFIFIRIIDYILGKVWK